MRKEKKQRFYSLTLFVGNATMPKISGVIGFLCLRSESFPKYQDLLNLFAAASRVLIGLEGFVRVQQESGE